ncbi:MAG: methyltransferase [Thermodesulfobacteriota bacterium]
MTAKSPQPLGPRDDETLDGLFRNKVRVFQARRGYRVSEDAVILTWFVRPRAGELILDAGTGCGAIAFGLAVCEPTARVVGLEIQAGLADRAGRGRAANDLASRVWIVRGDARQADRLFRPGCFDVVVSNPPYHREGRGNLSAHPEKALARHQLMMPLEDLFRVSRELLSAGGRIAIIYPAAGADHVRQAMNAAGFGLSRMLCIHPHEGTGPGLVCVEACRGYSGRTHTESPLILYDGQGRRTPRAEAVLAGEGD